jgi:sugar-specific transcriptional regulator TrmB
MNDVSQEIYAALERRLAEIDDEAQRLQRALSYLADGMPAKARRRPRSKPRAKRGARAAQFLKIVDAEPGIRGAALAKRMGVQPSHVYSVASRLEEQGKIRKVDLGYQLMV